jgi:hypothetical protein
MEEVIVKKFLEETFQILERRKIMLNRKLLLFLTLVFATPALFVTPAVMAEWPEPPLIYDNLPMSTTITIPKGGSYTVTADVFNDQECSGDVACDKYVLHITSGDLTGINAIYLTTPRWNEAVTESIYCSEPLKVVEVTPEWQRNQNANVLYNLSGQDAMQFTHMEPGGYWYIALDKIDINDLVPGTICIEKGRYVGCGAIAVFDCPRQDCEPPPVIGPSVSTETLCWDVGTGGEVLSVSFSYVLTGLNVGEVDHDTVLWYRNSSTCQGTGVSGAFTPPGHEEDYCLSHPGGKKECWQKKSHSPGEYTVCNSSGCTTYTW